MISETIFASQFTSTWRNLAPTSELFVRDINSHMYEREFAELTSVVVPARRGLINEVAFNAFMLQNDAGVPRVTFQLQREDVAICFNSARILIGRLDNIHPSEVAGLNQNEVEEINAIAHRLWTFFRKVSGGYYIECMPEFKGCGIVDGCRGDVLVAKTLFEVKAGGRKFRSVDLRQLLTYSSLEHQTGTKRFQRVGLFNPRIGLSVQLSLRELCFEVSGKPPEDLFSDIIDVLSGNEMSR